MCFDLTPTISALRRLPCIPLVSFESTVQPTYYGILLNVGQLSIERKRKRESFREKRIGKLMVGKSILVFVVPGQDWSMSALAGRDAVLLKLLHEPVASLVKKIDISKCRGLRTKEADIGLIPMHIPF